MEGDPKGHHQVFDVKVRALKRILSSLPVYSKDSAIIKKFLAREGNWTFIKEVLGWTIYTEAGKVTLLERKLQELLTRVIIPTTKLCMVQKK